MRRLRLQAPAQARLVDCHPVFARQHPLLRQVNTRDTLHCAMHSAADGSRADDNRAAVQPPRLHSCPATAALPPTMCSGVAFEVTAIGNVDGLPGLRSVPAALIGWTNSIAANLCFFPAGLIQVGASPACEGLAEGGGSSGKPACGLLSSCSPSLYPAAVHHPSSPPTPPPQMVEAANMDWDGRQRAWAASGRHLPRPRRRLLPTRHDLRTVSWWAALVQLSGMLGFNIATVSSLLAYTVAMQARARLPHGRVAAAARCACCAPPPPPRRVHPENSHPCLCMCAGHS